MTDLEILVKQTSNSAILKMQQRLHAEVVELGKKALQWKEGCHALELALETERDAANLYAKQVAHWIEKHDEVKDSLDFYKRRVESLQQWQSKMRDPERTVVCDILANGHTLEPAGNRYTPPGMAVQALAGEIIEALLADEKDGGYDLTAGMFGPAFSKLVRRWANAEWATTPPAAQRTWVGLTDEEVDEAARYCVKSGQSVNAAIRAIEAKLKERNV
jgi:hypothetical protein